MRFYWFGSSGSIEKTKAETRAFRSILTTFHKGYRATAEGVRAASERRCPAKRGRSSCWSIRKPEERKGISNRYADCASSLAGASIRAIPLALLARRVIIVEHLEAFLEYGRTFDKGLQLYQGRSTSSGAVDQLAVGRGQLLEISRFLSLDCAASMARP